jgi:hypothetical protein
VKTLRTVKSDPQREAYYEAEDQFRPLARYGIALKWPVARKIVRHVRSLYGLPPVTLCPEYTRSRWGGHVGETESGYRISLFDKDSLDLHFVLHELAHVVVMENWENAEHHGREFCGVVAWLFNRYRIIPADALAVIYRRYKIRALPFVECSPPAVRALDARRK